MNLYGAVITARDVREAVITNLKDWSPAYIGEVSVQSGRVRCGDGALPPFRSFGTATSMSTFPEDQLPACVVVVPGLAETPLRQGDGTYLAEWSVGIGVVVSGKDRESTDDLVRLYSAAVRMAMIQKPSMGGFALGCRWIDENYDELAYDDSRTIAAGIVSIGVKVDAVVNAFGGPKEPPEDACVDPGEYGTVQATPLTSEDAWASQ
jgi:hypothetical protein